MSNSRPAPYMVALSGWPEPVYIAGPPLGSSRSGTPGPSSGGGEYREGVSRVDIEHHAGKGESSLLPFHLRARPEAWPPAESIFSKTCMYNNDPNKECLVPDHPNHIAKYAQQRSSVIGTPTRAESPAQFPTSSARSTPHPSPPGSRRGSPKPQHLHMPHNSSPLTVSLQDESSSHSSAQCNKSFSDPRYAPHAAVLTNRPALELAPSWASSSVHSGPHHQPSVHPHSTGVGVRVPAGQRGTGILVMRAVPDVYPAPSVPGIAGMAAEMSRTASSGSRRKSRADSGRNPALEVATEVYPRDPDSAILWSSASRKSSMASISVKQQLGAAGEGGMELDES
ncbi:hypothetical protein BD324DRAFT_652008 [Kockovaella imperatae]|uniref:Uncharacterized protein n=1 Tax=Kockovaella imperatae TaxID=4999 RepID=A0A1Y1UF11_9TREE|nr:hypothetical protein BD324DRAFT_652008 [Kockovaella imperatae]ORX36104.1 hypothetical protein BD324DRAFT_652008 [Kockovaella imperatae]